MLVKKFDYILYTDGGARRNPGPAGAGAVIKNAAGVTLREIAKPLGIQTNNYAEYQAVILALEELKKIVPKEKRAHTIVEMRMDSELIARQLSGVYQIKEETLFPLYIKVHNILVADFPQVTFTHIPREKNTEADKLSNDAMDLSEGKGSQRTFL